MSKVNKYFVPYTCIAEKTGGVGFGDCTISTEKINEGVIDGLRKDLKKKFKLTEIQFLSFIKMDK